MFKIILKKIKNFRTEYNVFMTDWVFIPSTNIFIIVKLSYELIKAATCCFWS